MTRNRAPNTILSHACRIALLESDRAASSLEILQRIAKRGSFAFEGIADPADSDRGSFEADGTTRGSRQLRSRIYARMEMAE
jgi:hypothetical protein